MSEESPELVSSPPPPSEESPVNSQSDVPGSVTEDTQEPLSPNTDRKRKEDRKKFRERKFRRNLRKKLFKIEKETDNERKTLLDPHRGKDISSMLNRENALFNQIECAREANIDSLIMKNLSETTVKQLDNISLGKEFDSKLFIEKFRQKYCVGTFDADEETVEVDWDRIGKDWSGHFGRPGAVTFMNGPLERKLKKRKAQRRRRRVLGDAEKPEVLAEDNRQETSTKFVSLLKKKIKNLQKEDKKKKVNLLNVLVDDGPDGFTKTIENFFYFSFLAKDDVVTLDLDPATSCLFTQYRGERDADGGERVTNQHIFSMDQETYKTLIRFRDAHEDATMDVEDEQEMAERNEQSRDENVEIEKKRQKAARSAARKKATTKTKKKKKKKTKRKKRIKEIEDEDEYDDEDADYEEEGKKKKSRKRKRKVIEEEDEEEIDPNPRQRKRRKRK